MKNGKFENHELERIWNETLSRNGRPPIRNPPPKPKGPPGFWKGCGIVLFWMVVGRVAFILLYLLCGGR
jgi:hypothetical protein